MGRPRRGRAKTVKMDLRVSAEHDAFLERMASTGKMGGKADVVRLGIETLAAKERGEVVVLMGPAARAIRQTAADIRLDVETTAIMATAIIVLVADVAPQIEGRMAEMISEVKARAAESVAANGATPGPGRDGVGSEGTRIRTGPRPRRGPGDQ